MAAGRERYGYAFPDVSDPRYLSTLSITLGVAFCF